jgi:hypothetical protein
VFGVRTVGNIAQDIVRWFRWGFATGNGKGRVVAALEGIGLPTSMLRSDSYGCAVEMVDTDDQDIQPSNILLCIKDKQALHRRLQEDQEEATADTSPNTLVHSDPLMEEDDLYEDHISVKIIDFGVGISSFIIIPDNAAAPTDHKFTETIQPIALRAPEVVLGLHWGTPADIWNAASVVSSPKLF